MSWATLILVEKLFYEIAQKFECSPAYFFKIVMSLNLIESHDYFSFEIQKRYLSLAEYSDCELVSSYLKYPIFIRTGFWPFMILDPKKEHFWLLKVLGF